MRGVFDLIGPVMIGPSSSHTAGAVRLGLMARKILDDEVQVAEIFFHGSFAKTYRGHGTDKAILAGILGFAPEDERIVHVFDIAKQEGLKYSFQTICLEDAHPNTAIVKLCGKSTRSIEIRGSSIGGGNIILNRIGNYEVNLTGKYPTLITIHLDLPGVVMRVTALLARYELNIAFMHLLRERRGETAMMVIELDEKPPAKIASDCKEIYEVQNAFLIPAI